MLEQVIIFSLSLSSISFSTMAALAQENIWYNKSQCEEAERLYYEKLSGAKVIHIVGYR